MSFFGKIGGAIKGAGHLLAKPVGVAARLGGAAGGFMLGGPGGAMAGYRFGDKLGNIEEDALAGRNVRKNLGSNALGMAEGGAGMALAGGGIPGMGGGGGDTSGGGVMSKIGGALKSAGGQLANNFKKPDGSIDFSKLMAAGGAGMNLVGQAKQRKSATNYNNAQIDQRNQLMNKLMAPTNYNLPKISPAPNLNEQASASGAY